MKRDESEHVFINCPFDDDYAGLLYAMIFTIVSLGYYPRLSLDSSNATITRIEKITALIQDCTYCIHDLSRIKATAEGEYFRMNMPFELGMDFGYTKYSNAPGAEKRKTLILGDIQYEYIKALSDLSGIDILYHKNDAMELIKWVRNWFVQNIPLKGAPSSRDIWYRYADYNTEFKVFANECGCEENGIYDIPMNERIDHMYKFLEKNPYQ